MSDKKKEKKDNGGLEAVARKALEIGNAVAAEVRKLKEQLVNEGVISNPAATMSGSEAFRAKGKGGFARVGALLSVVVLAAVVTVALAETVTWTPFDSTYGTFSVVGDSATKQSTVTATQFVGGGAGLTSVPAVSVAGSVAATTLSASGATALSGSVTIAGGGVTTRWDNAASKIDGEAIADDTIDNDSIDWADMTDLDTDGTVTWGNITEGELGANKVTSANIKDGEIVDADLSATLAMTHTKLAAIEPGYLLVGSASSQAVAVAVSGDVTISDAGAVDIAADTIGTAEMADADHGDISWSGGVASLDADVVAAAEMADADHGEITWAAGVATIDSGVVDSDNIADGTVTLADVNVSGLTGVGNATAEAVGSAVEYVGAVHSIVYTFTNVVLSLTNGADNADSAALLTFPEGRIYILGAAINATVACTTNVWEDSANDIFYVGIGTAAAAQDATLAGTEQDVIAVETLDTVAAGGDGGTVFSFEWEDDMTAGADSVFDGTASAVKLYANTCVADTSISGDVTVTITGSARFHYIFLGDD